MLERALPLQQMPHSGPSALGDIFDAPQAPHLILVTHGVLPQHLPVVGMTVGEVRSRFADALDLDPRSGAQLDGRPVSDETRIEAGQQLTFTRAGGEKGRDERVPWKS